VMSLSRAEEAPFSSWIMCDAWAAFVWCARSVKIRGMGCLRPNHEKMYRISPC